MAEEDRQHRRNRPRRRRLRGRLAIFRTSDYEATIEAMRAELAKV